MTWISASEAWLQAHPFLVGTLGLPALTGAIWFFAQKRSENREAQTRDFQFQQQQTAQKFQRQQEKELRIAEFRQAWIISLRDSIAYYGQMTSVHENWESHRESVIGHALKIEMMMNPNDEDYEALIHALKYRADAAVRGGTEDLNPRHDNLLEIGQRILKREWERLKEDLVRIEDTVSVRETRK